MIVKSIKIRQMKVEKVKKAAFLFFAVMANFSVQAQDTTSFKEIKDERVIDSLENLLLEGEYGKSMNADFTFSRFTLKKNKMSAHGSGIFLGFTSLASRNLSDVGCVNGAAIKYGFDVGWTLLGLNARLSKKQGWFLYAGIGLGSRMFASESNSSFQIDTNNRIVQVYSRNDIVFSNYITQAYLHAPIFIEYQKKLDSKNHFFFQLGADIGVNFINISEIKYLNANDETIKDVVKIKKYVNPIAVDFKAAIGLNNISIYFKYGLIDVFKKGRGPVAIPASAGLIYHF